MVRKDATIKLFGGAYETDPVLAGRRVECVFDPFDLAVVEVRWNGKPYGLARPQHIRRHSHPKAKPEDPAAPPPATGIDYLGIIAAEHEQAARRHRIRYDALADDSTTASTTGRRTGSDRAAGAARRDQRPDRLGRAAVPHRAGQRQPRRDRRLPGRQGRPAGTHRRRARHRRLGPPRHRHRPPGGGRARQPRTPPRAAAAGITPRRTDMIDLRNHYGFTRTPFGKDLAPSMLCHYPAHAEAVARITWCARERAAGRDHGRSRLRARRSPPAPPSPRSTRPGTP